MAKIIEKRKFYLIRQGLIDDFEYKSDYGYIYVDDGFIDAFDNLQDVANHICNTSLMEEEQGEDLFGFELEITVKPVKTNVFEQLMKNCE